MSLVLQPLILLLPGLRHLLGLDEIHPVAWLCVAGGVIASWLVAVLYTRHARARHGRSAARGFPAGRSGTSS